MNNNLSVAVVVCTIVQRRQKLVRCVDSLLKNIVLPDEIFILSGDRDDMAFSKQVTVITTAIVGLSAKQNVGVGLSKSDIVVFTDDDCIVSNTWIKTIKKTFLAYPNIDALFGPVKPNIATRPRGGKCPSIFYMDDNKFFYTPQGHQHIGSGNNMAIRRKTLLESGGFKTWLGSGTAAKSSGDAELIVRLLGTGRIMMHINSGNVVWHDRWLTQAEYMIHELDYLLGDTICYVYFSFTHQFALRRIRNRWKINFWRYAHIAKGILLRKRFKLKRGMIYALKETYTLVAGTTLGLFWRLLSK